MPEEPLVGGSQSGLDGEGWKKTVYDNTALGLESERLKLQQDVNQNISGVLEEESSYHYLNCMGLINEVKMEQMKAETRYLSGQDTLNNEFKSYHLIKTIKNLTQMFTSLSTLKGLISIQCP